MSLELPGADVKAVVMKCRAAGVVVNRRAGRLRVSPHCYNMAEQLDQLVQIIRSPV